MKLCSERLKHRDQSIQQIHSDTKNDCAYEAQAKGIAYWLLTFGEVGHWNEEVQIHCDAYFIEY